MALCNGLEHCVISVEQLEFEGFVKWGMEEVEVVTNEHSSGPTVDKGRKLLRVGAKAYVNYERLSGSRVETESFL